MKWLDKLPWFMIIVFAVTIGLAPFAPEPHVIEKLKMLSAGNLARPIDIFDLLMHSSPWILIVLKSIRQFSVKR
ncbi:MAG: RND transporter [Sulfuriflexus sp.]|nr:RND transporter [Sulfuriflexus sp.]